MCPSIPDVTTNRSERATAAILVGLGVFQVALAAGAPWGRAAYGGTNGGTQPRHLRTVSGLAASTYGGGAVLILRGSGSSRVRARAFTALSVFMGVGVLANGASRSPVERALWTPVAAATTVLAWRSRTARV